MNKPSEEPAPFTVGCISLVMYPTWILSVLCFLCGAIQVALCLWGIAGGTIFVIWLTSFMFGERQPAPGRQKENIAYHREVHASETVYTDPREHYRARRYDVPPARPQESAPIPLSEYPPCKDPVTGRIYTAGELAEKLKRVRFGEV